MPTRPSQGDVMQARWGTHGDHAVIVLAPSSVKEIYEQTIRAFNLSERLRVPVVVLFDEVIGHLLETVELPDPASLDLAGRKWATGARESYLPFEQTDDLIPAMARPGDGYRCHTTGLTHAETGFPTQDPETVERVTRRVLDKLAHHRELVEAYEALDTADAEVLVVAIGISARAARRAVKSARQKGVKAGLFRPITLWPFPEGPFLEAAAGAAAIVVPEMNAGQLSLEIERLRPSGTKVSPLNRIDGEPVSPLEIAARIEELAGHG
jgi:2-oxoglutarate ferredoxin oxidoreductase subunit alpha